MMLRILLLAISTFLASAQEHGSPQGPPPPVTDTVFHDPPSADPTADYWNSWADANPPAPPAAPTLDPNADYWNSWLDANPLPKPSPSPDSDPGGIQLCTGTDFTGDCVYQDGLTYQCMNLFEGWRGKISSIQPNKNQLCIVYDELNCNGHVDWMRWPGSGNMRGRRFDNKAASWLCTDDDCDGVQSAGGCHENADGTDKNQKLKRGLEIAKGR